MRIDPNVPYKYKFKNGKFIKMRKVKYPDEFTGIPEWQKVHYENLDHHMKTAVYEAFKLCS